MASRQYEATRLPASQRGYNERWRKVRKMVLDREPLCRECKKYGISRLAEHVHHILETSERPDLFYSLDNLMPVCKPCHSKLSAKEPGAFDR